MRMRHALMLLMGLATLVPLVFFWFWLERTMIEKEIADVRERHLLIARNLGASLERYQRDVKSGFQLISENLASDQSLSKMEIILKDLNFTNMFLVDLRSGFVRWQSGLSETKLSAPFPAQMLNVLRAYAMGSEPRFSAVMRGSDGKPSIFVVKRIGNQLAIGELKTDYFVNLGKSVAFGEKGHAAIVDHEGNVIAHPLQTWVEQRKNISRVSTVQRMLRGEHGVEIFHSPALKADMIAGFATVEGSGWGVMIPQPMAELRARAQVARNSLFIVVALFVTLAAALAFAMTSLISSPLRAIDVAARRLKSGNLGTRINVSGTRLVPLELREVQETFNEMASSLEQYQTQEQEKRHRAEEDAKLRKEYMARLAHELRTPLNAVIGFSDILRKEQFGPLGAACYRDYAADVHDNADHLLTLINELIEFHRIDSGIFALDESQVCVAHVIRRTCSLLQGEAERSGVQLNIDPPSDDVMLWADPAALQKMVTKLAAHGLSHAPKGAELRIATEMRGDDGFEICLAQSGRTYSPAELKNIAKPFHRAGGSKSGGPQTTGLDLAIVSKLAELHGAHLEFGNDDGRGAVARLIFAPARVDVASALAA